MAAVNVPAEPMAVLLRPHMHETLSLSSLAGTIQPSIPPTISPRELRHTYSHTHTHSYAPTHPPTHTCIIAVQQPAFPHPLPCKPCGLRHVHQPCLAPTWIPVSPRMGSPEALFSTLLDLKDDNVMTIPSLIGRCTPLDAVILPAIRSRWFGNTSMEPQISSSVGLRW